MRRTEIFYDKQGRLSLVEHKDMKSDVVTRRLKGKDVYRYLKSLDDIPIEMVMQSKTKSGDRRVIHDGVCVTTHNIKKMLDDDLMEDYLTRIYHYEVNNRDMREDRVTRENKHSGKKIIAKALVIALIVACAFTAIHELIKSLSPEEIYALEKDPDTAQVMTTDVDVKGLENTTTTNEKETESIESETEEYVEEEAFAYIEYEDRTQTEKAQKALALYGDIIEEQAEKYGLDPVLVLAIATQERGIHSSTMDPGGATGLMQIQNSVWVGNSITAYNFETESYETFTITEEKLADCATNIKIGCMILQDTIKNKDYNILAGIQSYNMGGGSVNKILNACATDNGTTKDEILNDPMNCDWLNYRELITAGDPIYLEHVLSYMGSDINTYIYKPSGEKIETPIKNNQPVKASVR